MSNNSYLRCIGEGATTTNELYAEYTLPDGWAQLFAPDELHVGHPRDHAVASSLLPGYERATTSFLLCEAAVGLDRFAQRMTKRGIPITGKGMTARVHAWLAKHLAKGWWFADTTELEWWEQQPGEGVASMRRQLDRAAEGERFEDPTPERMLITFGWGTGLSSEEIQRKKQQAPKKTTAVQRAQQEAAAEIAAARLAPVDVATLSGRPYGSRESFKVGEQIAHPVFKTGVVKAVTPTTITVEFSTGPQLLAHQRK